MSQEFRRARRRKAPDTIVVTDAMTGNVVGRVANLSETGMLLLANTGLVNDALYQFRFTLPGGRERRDQLLELGAHLLWTDQVSAAGQAWTGLRFIGLNDEQARQLRAWVDTPGSQYV
ncbi:PilZ domain-containing protein [Luteimonas sp. RD2P54]|uniref:PilZ domain-containing protein n=1 Tax=Luteimonas endophytica TaxID=3042023 RepID=A0ABT6J7W3_9GAMM|nr:PilZ domain-containing protein [Luteimonas endophytica]MDH5822914.1 PilZ domain-containing protein [Luteimonas endophytica]